MPAIAMATAVNEMSIPGQAGWWRRGTRAQCLVPSPACMALLPSAASELQDSEGGQESAGRWSRSNKRPESCQTLRGGDKNYTPQSTGRPRKTCLFFLLYKARNQQGSSGKEGGGGWRDGGREGCVYFCKPSSLSRYDPEQVHCKYLKAVESTALCSQPQCVTLSGAAQQNTE